MEEVKKCFVLIGFMLLATTASAQPQWIVQIGVDNNTYPGGSNDPFNYFGILEGSIDDYPDQWDVVDPGYPDHSVALIFRGDQKGNNPTYPEGGLAWDIREPFQGFFKIWKVEFVGTDAGYTCDVYYDFSPFDDYPLPEGWGCFIDMDGEINGDNYLDLNLYEIQVDQFVGDLVVGYPQPGDSESWYILAGPIPEPQFTEVAGLILCLAGIGSAGLRKWRN
jgi:hypothetical protein